MRAKCWIKYGLAVGGLVLIVAFFVCFSSVEHELFGGELYAQDFEGVFTVYIEEGYTYEDGLYYDEKEGHFAFQTGELGEHYVWQVTDEKVAGDIHALCKKIEHYRERRLDTDFFFGGEVRVYSYFPVIYFDTGKVGYKIELINWDNYTLEQPIVSERRQRPTLLVLRCDMSSVSEDAETRVEFLRGQWKLDSVNSDLGAGWYSIMDDEPYCALLEILEAVNASTAEMLYAILAA